MLVKDVYKKIENLEEDRREFVKIQEFCLGNTGSFSGDITNTKIYSALEDGAGLDTDLRSLCSRTIKNIDDEITRLKKIIENTQVKID